MRKNGCIKTTYIYNQEDSSVRASIVCHNLEYVDLVNIQSGRAEGRGRIGIYEQQTRLGCAEPGGANPTQIPTDPPESRDNRCEEVSLARKYRRRLRGSLGPLCWLA